MLPTVKDRGSIVGSLTCNIYILIHRLMHEELREVLHALQTDEICLQDPNRLVDVDAMVGSFSDIDQLFGRVLSITNVQLVGHPSGQKTC